MPASTVSPDNSDRHSDKVRTPLSRIFVSALNWPLDLITSDVEILLSRISNMGALMAFREFLRIRWPGSIIPGEHRPNPDLSFLIFAPPNTHIL